MKMHEYLVIYTNKDGASFHSIKIWPEIETMLRKMEVVGGRMRVFRLVGSQDPQLMRIIHCKDCYWLETMSGIHVEG